MKNFFIAKIRDSESAPRRFYRHRPVATTSTARRSQNASTREILVAQAFLSIPAMTCAVFSRAARVIAMISWRAVDACVLSVSALARQHFLKPDAVFLHVLVYSGCSASRFPSARSD
jgi:hypothetical protein